MYVLIYYHLAGFYLVFVALKKGFTRTFLYCRIKLVVLIFITVYVFEAGKGRQPSRKTAVVGSGFLSLCVCVCYVVDVCVGWW